MRGRNATSAAAPNQEQNRCDEQEKEGDEREVQRVPHDRGARVALLLYALFDNLEEGDVEYEDGECGGAREAAEAGAAAIGDRRAEERDEGECEGDEGDAKGDDVQDEDFGQRRRYGLDAGGQGRGEGSVDELGGLGEVIPNMRRRALKPTAVLQIGTETECAEVDERRGLVRRSRGCRPVGGKIDAQEVHRLEVRDVEGDHTEERGGTGYRYQAEDFVPGNHWEKRATEGREKEVGGETGLVLRQRR